MSVALTVSIEHKTGDKLDYSMDWTNVLASGETIAVSLWDVTSGTATIDSALSGGSPTTSEPGSINGAVTTIALITAAAGQDLHLRNTITTSASRVYKRTGTVSIVAAG